MINRLAIAIVVLCAAAAPSTAALAASGLTGRYATTIKGDRTLGGSLNGVWVLDFTKRGTYSATDNGATVLRGRFSTKGSTMTLGHERGPASCPASGRYRFKLAGRVLRFTRVSDTCPGRSGVLAHKLARKG